MIADLLVLLSVKDLPGLRVTCSEAIVGSASMSENSLAVSDDAYDSPDIDS